MNEGCEVHFCPIYCRIPHLNSINPVVWSERCWCKLDTSSTTSSSLAILFSKTRPDVQEHNHSGVSHQYTLPLLLSCREVLYSCVRKETCQSTCFLLFRICSSTVQIQRCNLLQLTQFTQFGADKTLLESRNGTPDTKSSTFSPLGDCIHFCTSTAFYQSLQRTWKLFNKFLYFRLTVGAVSVSSMQLVQREQRGWHFPLSHFHSFAVSNFTSSFNIFLFFCLKLGVMTLWQPDKK